MTIYVSANLKGITIEEALRIGTLSDGYVTADDVEQLRHLARAVVEDMSEAGVQGELDRVQYLDGLYQELIELIDDLACSLHNDYCLE